MIGRSTTRSTGRKAIRPIRSLVAGGQLVAYGGGGSASSKVCASINAATVGSGRADKQKPQDRTRQALLEACAGSRSYGGGWVLLRRAAAGCAVSELVAPELPANLNKVSAEKCDSLPGPMSVRRARFYWNTWKRGWASNEKTTQVGPFEAIFVSAKPCPVIPSPYLPPARTNPRWLAA